MSHERRVLITGVGVVSPLGNSLSDFWLGVCSGRVGFRVQDVDPLDYFLFEPSDRITRRGLMLVVAALHAVRDAGLQSPLPKTTMVSVGSACGFENGALHGEVCPRPAPPREVVIEMLYGVDFPGVIRQTLGVSGPTVLHCDGSAAGAAALGRAGDLIRQGVFDVALVVGVDVLHTEADAPLANKMALEWSGPFCSSSGGFIASEGAGCVILESAAHAERRGVRAYGKWEGWGGAQSDQNHTVRGVDLFHAVSGACRNAGCSPSMIDLVVLTGSGIPDSDAAELSMLEDLWKGEPNKPAVTTVGGHCGHVFGATGPIQVITGLACLSESRVPAVRNRPGRIGLWNDERKLSASQGNITRALTVTTGMGNRHVSTVVTRWHHRRKVNDMVYVE